MKTKNHIQCELASIIEAVKGTTGIREFIFMLKSENNYKYYFPKASV